MTFKPRIWYPIAGLLSVVNLAAVAVAANAAEPLHATTHTALALAFGLWAQRLRQKKSAEAMEPQERLEALEGDVSDLRQELTEAQERLDFTERMLAQRREGPRVGPERQDGI